MDNAVHMYLSNTDSVDYFPHNKGSYFRVKLSESLQLHGEWEAALTSLTVSINIHNLFSLRTVRQRCSVLVMLRNSDQARELYIPDFKLWNDYYEKKVKSHEDPEQSPQQACPSQANERAAAVKLQFVSPVTETTNEAASIMKTGNSKLSKKS